MIDSTNLASAGSAELCLPSHLRKPRLRRDEASEYLLTVHGVTVAKSTLEKYATNGGGPLFYKISNRSVVYARVDLDAWAVQKLGKPMRSTSDAEAPP